MKRYKTDQVTQGILRKILEGFTMQGGEQISSSILELYARILTTQEEIITVYEKETENAHILTHAALEGELLLIPLTVDQESKAMKLQLPNKAVDVEITQDLDSYDLLIPVFKYLETAEAPEPQQLFEIMSSELHNKDDYIVVSRSNDFMILKNRDQFPSLYLVTNNAKEDMRLHEYEYKILLELDEEGKAHAIIGTGKTGLIEASLSELDLLDERDYKKIIDMIVEFYPLTNAFGEVRAPELIEEGEGN